MANNWRQGSVLEQYKHMLDYGHRSDCSFIVGQEPDTKEFRAHKMIMSRSSEVFDAMFYGSLSEKDVVRVRDVTPAAFQALLYHVYCDTLEISDVKMALSVCSAAHKYNLQPLINKCTDYIIKHMTPYNVWRVLHFSDLTDNTELKTHCNKMLQCSTEDALSADSWCGVPESSIVTLLQQDTLNVDSELSLLIACQRWAQHQLDVNNQPEDCEASASKRVKCEPDVNNQQNDSEASASKKIKYEENKLRKMLEPFLPYIRILSLTPKQFLQATKNNQIFSDTEKLLILQSLNDTEEYKIPEGMCQINTPRTHPKEAYQISFKMKAHLKAKQIVTIEFDCCGYYFEPCNRVPIVTNTRIVVYGFSYKNLEFNEQKRVNQARLSKKKLYDENFTVQFINETHKCVVAEHKFEGTRQYNGEEKVEFARPFLVNKSIPHSLKIEFHHQHTDRKYPYFCKHNDSSIYYPEYDRNFVIPTDNAGNQIKFPCISKLFYKVG